MPPPDGTNNNNNSSNNNNNTQLLQRRRRRYTIPLFAAAILFICVAQLEEFNVGWKELTSSQSSSTGSSYIRSNSTSGWKEQENNQQEQRQEESQQQQQHVPSSKLSNISTGWQQPVVKGNNHPTEGTGNVSNMSGETAEPASKNQPQETESTHQEDGSTTTSTTTSSTNTTGWDEWESNHSEMGNSTNNTSNHTMGEDLLESNQQEEKSTNTSTDGSNKEGTSTNTTDGEDQQPEQHTTNPSSSTNTSTGETIDTNQTTTNTTTTRLKSQDERILHEQICSKIPPGMSASKIWQLGLPIIEQGLQHPMDVDFAHRDWTHALLELLQPFLLKGSVRAQPSWQLAFPMMVKLAKHLQDPEWSPSLKIVVMGGSIPEGVQCRNTPLGAIELPFRTLQICSWPTRLHLLLNHVIQSVWNTTMAIDIKNIATGGTNTAAATPVVQYWLNQHFQSSTSRRGSSLDMIINGYAANDNIPDGKDEVDDVNTTISNFHYFSKLEYAVNFAREVANMNAPADGVNDTSCHAYPKNHKQDPPDPLLLFLNDYYGNLQLSVVGEGQRDEAVQWLTDMHEHTGYVSPPHSTILRWIWANIDDEIFSGVWMKNNQTAVNVHYGMSGHVTDAIFIAYYMLQMVLDVCEQVAVSPNNTLTSESVNDTISEAEVASLADSFSNGHAPDEYLRIDASSVSIQESSWTTLATTPHTCEASPDSSTTQKTVLSPCTFAFLTAAMGSHKTPEQTNVYLQPYTKEQKGWNVENDFRYGGFQNKMGLVANETNAKMVLATTEKKSVQQPIKFVTVYYLKSYGEDWDGSIAQFDIEVHGLPSDRRDPSSAPLLHTESFTLKGFHDQALSTTYIFKQELGVPVPVGGSMQLTMTLVGGKRFKIIAIMWCSK